MREQESKRRREDDGKCAKPERQKLISLER
jgi:hypothetical protein